MVVCVPVRVCSAIRGESPIVCTPTMNTIVTHPMSICDMQYGNTGNQDIKIILNGIILTLSPLLQTSFTCRFRKFFNFTCSIRNSTPPHFWHPCAKYISLVGSPYQISVVKTNLMTFYIYNMGSMQI